MSTTTTFVDGTILRLNLNDLWDSEMKREKCLSEIVIIVKIIFNINVNQI